jgi:hypothetical protein
MIRVKSDWLNLGRMAEQGIEVIWNGDENVVSLFGKRIDVFSPHAIL